MSECAYCLCDDTNMKLHCGHVFHRNCIFTAVKIYHNDFCPLFREQLTHSDYFNLCYVMNYYITDNLLYTGDFVNNQPHGYGLMRSLWYSYSGEWEKGMKHGEGVFKGFKRIYFGPMCTISYSIKITCRWL